MSDQASGDSSLLELFKQEAETHTVALSQGLIEWENNLTDITKIEPLMRAAHSLKGAARIIGLNTYSHLAHLLEDCFVSAQKGKVSFEHEDFDILLKAVDFLTDVTKLPTNKLSDWPGDDQPLFDTIKEEISDLLTTSPSNLKKTEEHKLDLSSPTSGIEKIFLNELKSQTQAIRTALENLKNNPGNHKLIDQLITAASAIKGTSAVVENLSMQAIAQKLESTFILILNQELPVSDETLSLLVKIIDTITPSENNILGDVAYNTSSDLLDKLSIYSKTAKSQPKPKVHTPAPLVPVPETETVTAPQPDNVVRVSARNLDRLMSIAAESVVETRKLMPIKQGLLQLKALHHQLAHLIDLAQTTLNKSTGPISLDAISKQVSDNSNTYRSTIQIIIEQFDNFTRNNNALSSKFYSEILGSRMRPFNDGIQGLPRLIRNLSRSLNKEISLEIHGKETPVDRDILEKLEAPLNHIIRNACDHGIESPTERTSKKKPEKGTIKVNAFHKAGMLVLTIKDDGQGIDMEALRKSILAKKLVTEEMGKTLSDEELLDFLFLPGFSTTTKVTEISGRGVGLDTVHNLMQEVGGTTRIETERGIGTTFYLQLPITRSVIRTLLVEIDNEPYALPLSEINRAIALRSSEIITIDNREYFKLQDRNVALISAHQLLGFQTAFQLRSNRIPVVVLGENENQHSIIVDHILGETELVVRPLDPRLGKVPCTRAVSITEEGLPVLILDVDDLLNSTDKIFTEGELSSFEKSSIVKRKQKRVLVVDDSITVRETQRQLLQNAGYDVEVAVDGADGWNTLHSSSFDLIITDVDMPRMNGFELVALIKKDPKLKKIPVIIISYKDRETDRLQGLEAGADYYLAKSSFRDDTFINVVQDLIGSAY